MCPLLLCSADNVKVSPDGSVITITNARPVNHGAYRCVASNPFGITHTIVSLIVRGKLHAYQHWTHSQTHFATEGLQSSHTPKPLSEGFPLVADQIQSHTSILYLCPQSLLWPPSPLLDLCVSGLASPLTWNARRQESPAPQSHGTGWTATARPC